MNRTAYLVNVSRGEIVDLADLPAAPRAAVLAGRRSGRLRSRAAPARSRFGGWKMPLLLLALGNPARLRPGQAARARAAGRVRRGPDRVLDARGRRHPRLPARPLEATEDLKHRFPTQFVCGGSGATGNTSGSQVTRLAGTSVSAGRRCIQYLKELPRFDNANALILS